MHFAVAYFQINSISIALLFKDEYSDCIYIENDEMYLIKMNVGRRVSGTHPFVDKLRKATEPKLLRRMSSLKS
jgi:hypothetical protein